MSLIKYISFNGVSNDTQSPCALCLGSFDGVHIGHRALISEALKMKYKFEQSGISTRAAALCFSTIPANFFAKGKVKVLMTLEEKLDTFRRLGLDGAYVCDFSLLSSYSPESFINEILISFCNAVGVVCGFNYSFGAKAKGDRNTLREYFTKDGYAFCAVEPVIFDGKIVSSSLIRSYATSGNMERAASMLGEPFYVAHKIVHGKNLGTKLGFPTINHIYDKDSEMIVPALGIYATKTEIDGTDYIGVTNVGTRPTVSSSGVVTCETHLIEMPKDTDLYGKTARVKFFKKLRDEKKFASREELSAAIASDVENTINYFGNNLLK